MAYKKTLNLIILSILFITTKTLAVTLYRGDSRPPEVIFEYGFNPPGGGSFDIIRHTTGQSCFAGTATSAFVSLSRSEVAAHDFADEQASATRASLYYVYEVESDSSYIDVTGTFQAARSHPIYTPSQRLRLINMLSVADSEDEVLSEFTVLNSSVVRVHIYASPSGDLIETRENPNFEHGTGAEPIAIPVNDIPHYLPPSSVDNSTNAWYASSDSDSDSDSSTACFMGGACSSLSSRTSAATCVEKKVIPIGEIIILDEGKPYIRTSSNAIFQ
ncbi:scabin-related ADP-ribosyltransferase [Enterovibrio nigricans]|uniref:Pertussis toxin, subunit 1 n=1 Tax=Enterovibrio nigricans DSM 22720 TaxID=1121868 RepID=A0A1T4WCY7_9GAMM|nr:enterotoxin A family protein [Enterovibrio nigricans]SKA74888.1 Pertussis toxin, subunit 1 [Enterovibrio nigricans DSM 22720]